jgi:GntR family transcriptional regulator / MocR family aminotransferase
MATTTRIEYLHKPEFGLFERTCAMARQKSGALLPGLNLTRSGRLPISRELFQGLREVVISGRLKPGTRLPATRSLATELGVSRTTVAQAYDQLKSEGYLLGREKSGTFITDVLPGALAALAPRTANDDASKPTPPLSARMAGTFPARPERGISAQPFHPGIPDIAAFPALLYARLQRQVSLNIARSGAARCPAEGAPVLREQVAAYLGASRGVACDPSQVFIISGTHHALHLILLGLSNPGDGAWIENPGYPGARKLFSFFRLRTTAVPVDEEGIVVAEGRRRGDDARFAYVTPARQAPLGHTMSLSRRLELLRWAHDRGALILEDDYDGEYRFGGAPAPSLQSLDPDGRVLYFGTFSKTLLPSLGIGYLVVPRRYVETVSRLIDLTGRPPNLATQLTVARMIESGAFESHVRAMRIHYRRRQDALQYHLRDALAGLATIETLNAGLHLIGWLPASLDDRRVAENAWKRGLLPRPLSDFVVEGRLPPALMLGFSNLPNDRMSAAIDALRQAILEA